MNDWKLERDGEGLAWATLDCAGQGVNILSRRTMAEFAALLDALDAAPPRALVIRSGKDAGFVAGADIEEFSRIATPADARELVARGWDLFNRLAALPWPTLALLRGHCMGGGLELALACRYRIAVDEPGTRFALPEVMLGIVPGWGGMLRLPRVVGPTLALDMMLTGRSIDARRAGRSGLADAVAAPRIMDNAARVLVLSGAPPRRPPFVQRLLAAPPIKSLVAAQARRQVAARARPEHYPAPYAILDIWARHGGNALAVPDGDPAALAALVASPTTRNLVRVYHLQERLKGYGKDPGKSGEAEGFTARRVHVVGAGVMGGDIAAWCALRGLTVSLQDRDMARIAQAVVRARKLFEQRLKDKGRVRAALDRLVPDPDGAGVRHADVVIEAIYENLDAKRALLAAIEPQLKPGAVLASNTSSLRLADLAAALRAPQRLIGLHFFNPVAKMPLIEVVRGEASEPGEVARGAAFVRQIDRLPLPVRDVPGFLVNRLLAPYMLEALRAVDEGIAPEKVDEAALAFGMPMGPVELADTVGLDIALAVGRNLGQDAAAPPSLLRHVEAGELGRKSGRGYYAYEKGRPVKHGAGTVPAGLAERLLAPLFAAARECVRLEVVEDADLADAGAIFGAGFAPYTGGPLHHLAQKEKQS